MPRKRETKRWPVQDAKARFSELLDASLTSGPQIVTRRGEEMAVLVRVDHWRQLEEATRPRLKGLVTRRGTASGDSGSASGTAPAGTSCVRVSDLVPARYERCVRIAQAAASRRGGDFPDTTRQLHPGPFVILRGCEGIELA